MLGLSARSSESAQELKGLPTGLRDRGLAVDRYCALVIGGGMVLC